MKNKNHGLSEKEMELAKLLMAECETTADIQNKLKKLFAETIEQSWKQKWTSISVMRKIQSQGTIPETAVTVTARRQ